MEISCRDILAAVKGEIVQAGNLKKKPERMIIDSREVTHDDFFVPLCGESTDGHFFLGDAAQRGACGCFIGEDHKVLIPENITVIKVKDTLQALQRLAEVYRSKFSIPVIGVTGSNGKTTTKDLIAAVLSKRYNTLKTEGNLNNHIGLPLMISRLQNSHSAAVFEMGMSGRGEIACLAHLAQPAIGVITNIGESHLEALGSRENIAAAKCELLPFLSETGTAVLNADEPLLVPHIKCLRAKLITFGFSVEADICCASEKLLGGKKHLRLEQCGFKPLEISTPLPGRHNIYNLMAAVAVARELGLKNEEIVQGLTDLCLTGMRLEIETTPGGINIINDAYNASPSSMAAALDVLVEKAGNAGKIAVLGDMLELGGFEDEGHLLIGRLAAEKGIDALVLLGSRSKMIAKGAMQAGYAACSIFDCSDHAEAARCVMTLAKKGDWVLIKGSRGMCMEKTLTELSPLGREETE